MSADDRPAETNQTTDTSTAEPTQTTEIGNVDINYASYVAADRVYLSNAPENPIQFTDLTEQERPFIEVALDRGWVCRAGNTEAWEAFTERVLARRHENQYLKRDETYYGLWVSKLDQMLLLQPTPWTRLNDAADRLSRKTYRSVQVQGIPSVALEIT